MTNQLSQHDRERIQKLHDEQEAARLALAKEIGCSIDTVRCVIRQSDRNIFRPIAVTKRKSSWAVTVSEYAANKRQKLQETAASGSENSVPGQLFKEAAKEYKALSSEQKDAAKERGGTWSKPASFSEASRAWKRLLDGFDNLARQTRNVFGVECVTLFTPCTYKYRGKNTPLPTPVIPSSDMTKECVQKELLLERFLICVSDHLSETQKQVMQVQTALASDNATEKPGSYAEESKIIYKTILAKYNNKLRTLNKNERVTIPWRDIQHALAHGNGFVPRPWKAEWKSKFAAPEDMKAIARNALLQAIYDNSFDFIWKEQAEAAEQQSDALDEEENEEDRAEQ